MEAIGYWIVLALGLFFGALTGFTTCAIIHSWDKEVWQAECIARGVARFNPEDARFEWTVERKDEK